MAVLSAVITVLRKEREIAAMALAKLDDAITTLQKLSRSGTGRRGGAAAPKARRRMSAAGRRRIAAAQRARWAKLRAKQAKKAA